MKSLEEDVRDGLAYGFPVCCVLKFIIEGGTANPRQALERGIAGGENPYIPCGFLHQADDPEKLSLIQQNWRLAEGRYVND